MRHLLRTREAAERVGVPEATLLRWRKEGTAPASLRAGKHVLWPVDEIERWIDDRLERAGSDEA